MAKKKKAHKKHYPKAPMSPATAPVSGAISHQSEQRPAVETPKTPPSSAPRTLAPVMTFDPGISHDVLRTVLLAGGLCVAQVLLWLLMSQTSLGSTVYGWINL